MGVYPSGDHEDKGECLLLLDAGEDERVRVRALMTLSARYALIWRSGEGSLILNENEEDDLAEGLCNSNKTQGLLHQYLPKERLQYLRDGPANGSMMSEACQARPRTIIEGRKRQGSAFKVGSTV